MVAGDAEAAIEAADLPLVDSRLDRVPFVFKLSKPTLRTIT